MSCGRLCARRPTIAATATPSPAVIGCRRRRTARCFASSSIRPTPSGSPRIAREEALPDDSGRAEATDRNNPRHAGFHKTATIDYAIVLSGEIYAMMDEGEVLLKAGDVLIQRGTNHAWSNRTNEPAVVAFVLIDAEPV